MPTENERKFVLRLEGSAEEELRQARQHHEHAIIWQGYLLHDRNVTCRIRSAKHYRRDFQTDDTVRTTLTVKRRVRGRCVEVETPIDGRDFEDLWSACKPRLAKTRIFMDGWEVDYFQDVRGKVYFILAEHEMPEGQDYPEVLIPFVQDRLLFEVPREDDRFSNRKLGRVDYARGILSSLCKEA